MTDQPQNTIQRAPARRVNLGLIFCVLCLMLAVGIFLTGGSLGFAVLFGAISLYGILFFSGFDLMSGWKPDSSAEPACKQPLYDEVTHPANRILSYNIHNPDRHRNSFNDPFD